MASDSSHSAAQDLLAAQDPPEPTEEEHQAMRQLAASLFQMQIDRARHQQQSKLIDREMKKIKARCARWLERYDAESFALEEMNRKLRRSERKIYQKLTVPQLLDWIEEEHGVAARRRMEDKRTRFESTVRDTRVEYRITYTGVRKRGERVAADGSEAATTSMLSD